MGRFDVDAEIAAADQELSALLEKHINVPMKRSIEEVSGGLSLTLKGDLESSALSLRSELKKLNSSFEDLGDDLDNVRQVSKRIETMIQHAEGAQDGRFEKTSAQIAECCLMVTEGITGVEERLVRLSAAQLIQLNSLLKSLAAEVNVNRVEIQDRQQKTLEKLDGLSTAIAAQDLQALAMQRLSKRRYVWMCAALSLNLGLLVALLIKTIL